MDRWWGITRYTTRTLHGCAMLYPSLSLTCVSLSATPTRSENGCFLPCRSPSVCQSVPRTVCFIAAPATTSASLQPGKRRATCTAVAGHTFPGPMSCATSLVTYVEHKLVQPS